MSGNKIPIAFEEPCITEFVKEEVFPNGMDPADTNNEVHVSACTLQEEEGELQSLAAVFISQEEGVRVSDMNAVDQLTIKNEGKTRKVVSLKIKKEVKEECFPYGFDPEDTNNEADVPAYTEEEEEDELQSFDAVFISQDDFIEVSDMNAVDPLIIKKENKTKKFVSLEKKKEVFPRQSSQDPEDHMKIGVNGQQYNTNVKRHNCEVCGKAFLYHSYLLSHMRVHTGERPYKCKVCSKTFTKYSSVKPHMRVHTGERPYKCQVCSKAFKQSSNLTHHMRVHTRETPFKCEVCSRTFTKYPSLTVHMRVHSC